MKLFDILVNELFLSKVSTELITIAVTVAVFTVTSIIFAVKETRKNRRND